MDPDRKRDKQKRGLEQKKGISPIIDAGVYDDNGTPTNLTDDSVSVVRHIVYDAFGNITSTTGTAESLFGFTARLLDPETGLQNNLNRWYDLSTGRWMSVDPIGFAAGDANLYRYCGNAAAWAVDPNGLKAAPLVPGIAKRPEPPRDDGPERKLSDAEIREAFRLKYSLMFFFTTPAGGKARNQLPHAVPGLEHYLWGTGKEQHCNPVDLLKDTKAFKNTTSAQVANAFQAALDHPKEKNFHQEKWENGDPVSMWDSFDWFGYFRGYSFYTTAKVLEHKPNCCLKMKVNITVFKRYNFDHGDEFFPIPGFREALDGTSLDNLRHANLAKPYDIWGTMQGTFCIDLGKGQTPADAAKAARNPKNWGEVQTQKEEK